MVGKHIVQANFMQFDDAFTGLGVEVGMRPALAIQGPVQDPGTGLL